MSSASPCDELVENEGVLCRRVSTCLLCQREGQVLYGQLRDRFFAAPGVWEIRWCRSCELGWLDPRPLPQEISKLYGDYYTHSLPEERVGSLRRLRWWIRDGVLATWLGYGELASNPLQRGIGWALGLFQVVRDPVELSVMGLRARSRGRLLDVGCGNGLFLGRMKELGWDVVGLEPDEEAARFAREKWGVRVEICAIHAARLERASIDVISMNHVVEHLSDPVRDLRRVREWLRPGGFVVLTTPNMKSIGHRRWREAWKHLDPPRHLFLFSKASLGRVLQAAGFSGWNIRTSSRDAADAWRVSCSVRSSGRAAAGRGEKRLAARVLGACVQAMEALWPLRLGAGEELVVVGS